MNPALSIVVTSRNDNHGGDAMKRMRVFTKGLISQCNRFQFPCELIFVEWNPPADKPLLNEVLPKPEPGGFLNIRYIIVPNSEHIKLRYSDMIPLYQMIAKNVGIRRAMAEFILCTNIDLLFSNELFDWIAKKELEKGFFYRANRCDVPSDLNENWDVQEQLKFCSSNVLKRLGVDRDNPYDFVKEYYKKTFKYKILKPVQKYRYKGTEQIARHPYHRVKSLDSNACGDFTLMHKDDWNAISGYQELEMYSLHIDTLALIAADALNIKQVVLAKENCTFHLQHADGWDTMEPLQKLRFYEKRPSLDWEGVKDVGYAMMEKGEVITVNKPDWGYSNTRLEEFAFP